MTLIVGIEGQHIIIPMLEKSSKKVSPSPYSQILLPPISTTLRSKHLNLPQLQKPHSPKQRLNLSSRPLQTTRYIPRLTKKIFHHRELRGERNYYSTKEQIQRQQRHRLFTLYFEKKVKEFAGEFIREKQISRIIDIKDSDLDQIEQKLKVLNNFIESEIKLNSQKIQ